MTAYVESVWAFKPYLIENITGEQANLIAQILTADDHLTQDDLALIESLCAEDKTEILLDILLNKQDKVWCDMLLDLLEGIGLNHLAKVVKGIESPEYGGQSKASTSKMMQHQATAGKPVDKHVNDNQIRASTSKAMQDEIGIAEPVDHDITIPKLIQLNICDVAADTDDENSVSSQSESEPCSSNNLSLNAEAGSGTDINLRNYQKELAGPGIAGQNCVIVAPTGTGKTHVAVHICKEHLKSAPGKKVVFLVPKVPLVQQQHETFRKHLDAEVKLTPVSGGGEASVPVGQLLKTSQVIIMTHQLLLNVLRINEFDMQDISLLIFDECHHTMKGHPYKQIMDHYMKLKDIHVFGSNKLPQIVGLTASPGSGKSSKQEQALEHIMKLLGNLDVTIAPVQVVKHKDELAKYDCAGNFDTISVPRPASDRFSETINGIMEDIEKAVKQMLMRNENVVKSNVPFDVPSRRGTPEYEQVVVEFNKQSLLLEDKKLSQKLHISAIHLRTYNDALLVNDHVRPSDARDFIEKALFEDMSIGNENKRLLKNLYDDSGAKRLATNQPSPLLQRLICVLREHFEAQPNCRCIVFARTREIARSLAVCIDENQSIGNLRLNPEFLTGSGARNSLGGLTKVEQDDRLKRFSDGICKLMIATTVAEEGIDIQACNLVLTYNHTTNEIAQVQRKGRGRAKGSKMYVLAYEDSNFLEKGNVNTVRDELTQRCLQELRKMHPGELAQKIRSIQLQQRSTASAKEQAKKKSDDEWRLLCKSCQQDVTISKHFRRIKKAHHIVVDQDFTARMVTRRSTPLSISDDEMRVGAVLCGDETCRQPWGMKMLYKGAPVYVLKIKNFVLVNIATDERILRNQWKKAPFEVKALDDEELISLAGMIDNDSDLDPLDVTVPSDSDDNLVNFSWNSE